MLLLKFLTNRFKSIGSNFKKENKISFTSSTIFLAFTELFMVVLGILLALYIDRWNTTQNHKKQFEATLRLIQADLINDIKSSDNVIANFNARDSLRHDVMLKKLDKEYYENGISYWQKIIVYYTTFNVKSDGYNLLLDMKEEVPKDYLTVYKKIKKLYRRIPIIDEYNKNFKKVIWDIKDELSYTDWYWIDSYHEKMSDKQIDFLMNDFYYKSLVQKVLNASALLNGVAIAHRIEAIDIYNEINDLLGKVEEDPKGMTYILTDSLAKKYIGKYKMIEGDSSKWFPKFYSDNLVLEIGIKDSCLYLIQDNEYTRKLYYFNRQYQNFNFPIKKHHIFISGLGFFEFYKKGKLKVGAAGPYSIWEKQ